MPEITIRPLGPGDREAWAGLRHALWPHHPIGELAEELDDMLTKGMAGFGAFSGERLVGFAETGERAYGDGCDSAPVAWLEGIYVMPALRRHGVARLLVGAVEAWARTRGLVELGSDAALDNVVSRLGHARWGFEETERSVMFRKRL